jgi:hypothetical protein
MVVTRLRSRKAARSCRFRCVMAAANSSGIGWIKGSPTVGHIHDVIEIRPRDKTIVFPALITERIFKSLHLAQLRPGLGVIDTSALKVGSILAACFLGIALLLLRGAMPGMTMDRGSYWHWLFPERGCSAPSDCFGTRDDRLQECNQSEPGPVMVSRWASDSRPKPSTRAEPLPTCEGRSHAERLEIKPPEQAPRGFLGGYGYNCRCGRNTRRSPAWT